MKQFPEVIDKTGILISNSSSHFFDHCKKIAEEKYFQFNPKILASASKHLQDLVRIRSVTGFEGKILHHITQTLENYDLPPVFDVNVYEPNIVVEYRGDPKNKKFTSFVSHVDTVDFDANEWSHAPDSGDLIEIDGEWKLYGRGSLDVKQGSAASLALIEALIEQPVDKNFRFVFYEGEETGDPTGASALIQQGIITPENTDVAFVIEPSKKNIIHGAFCNITIEVRVDGISGHSSEPDHAINAIRVLAEAIVEIDEKFERPSIRLGDELFVSTLAPTVFDTPDKSTNVIKGTASALFDLRLVPNTDPEVVRKSIETLLNCVCARHEAESKCTLIKTEQGGVALWNDSTDFDSDIMAPCQLPRKVYTLARAFNLKPLIGKFWSDLATMLSAGIPAVNIGGGPIERAHKKDEYLTIEELGDLMSQMCFLAFDGLE